MPDTFCQWRASIQPTRIALFRLGNDTTPCHCYDSGNCANPIDMYIVHHDIDGASTLYGAIITRKTQSPEWPPHEVPLSTLDDAHHLSAHYDHSPHASLTDAATWIRDLHVRSVYYMDDANNHNDHASSVNMRRIDKTYDSHTKRHTVKFGRTVRYLAYHMYQSPSLVYKDANDYRIHHDEFYILCDRYRRLSQRLDGPDWMLTSYPSIATRYVPDNKQVVIPSDREMTSAEIENTVFELLGDHDYRAALIFALIAFSYDGEYLQLLPHNEQKS